MSQPNDPITEKLASAALARFGEAFNVPEGLPNASELLRMLTHSSHRRWTEQRIDADLLKLLFACALSAPSKSDLQQADIIHVIDREKIKAIASFIPDMPWINDAPVFLVFCGNNRRVRQIGEWRGKPFVLLSTRLTEVRAFSDLFAEFTQALGTSTRFPKTTKIVVLCNRPSFEFSAFQELHERAVTLVEGSAVSGQDLVTVRAERAKAIMLLADRFSTDPESEDLGILFQVWASKSFTKTVPLFVQTVRQATVHQIALRRRVHAASITATQMEARMDYLKVVRRWMSRND